MLLCLLPSFTLSFLSDRSWTEIKSTEYQPESKISKFYANASPALGLGRDAYKLSCQKRRLLGCVNATSMMRYHAT